MAIDVSHWDGVIYTPEWKAILEAGHSIVYMKATQGDKEDPVFAENYQNATDAGLAVGAYTFLTALYPADASIDFFYKTVKKALGRKTMKLPAVLDIEESGLKPEYVTKALAIADKTFNRTCMIYGSKNFLETHLTLADLSTHPLWIAEYTMRDTPNLPNGCQEYAMWQYTDSGRLEGVQGAFDLNRVSPEFAKKYAPKLPTG